MKRINKEDALDGEMPKYDFFEEKEWESIIEKNDEESKFVDEESYSVVYLAKQQTSNIQKSSFKLANLQTAENYKEISKDQEENLKEFKNSEIIDEDENKGKSQSSINSISNINSPNFKVDSLIGDSEIKDTNLLINDIATISPTQKEK